jgi:hypothetical protein
MSLGENRLELQPGMGRDILSTFEHTLKEKGSSIPYWITCYVGWDGNQEPECLKLLVTAFRAKSDRREV